jgi:hypothetical protein
MNRKFTISGFIKLSMILISFSAGAKAESLQSDPEDQKTYKYYFMVDDNGASAPMRAIETNALLNPAEAFNDLKQMSDDVFQAAKNGLDLTKLKKIESSLPLPKQPYNRLKQFGRWVRPEPSNCQNTRALILIRDSKKAVTYRDSGKCAVETGLWNDPYTGQNFTSYSDIQIDHFVPLKNAYDSGAHKWDNKTRCGYANFMNNEFHLLSVNGKENMSKGDKSPDKYLPPNQAYHCEYVSNWLKVKLIWGLALVEPEVQAIQNVIKTQSCDLKQLKLDIDELNDNRNAASDKIPKACDDLVNQTNL